MRRVHFVQVCTASLSSESELGWAGLRTECQSQGGAGSWLRTAQHSAASLPQDPLPWSHLSCSNARNIWDKSAYSWHLKDLSPLPSNKRPICHFTFSALGVRHLGISEEKLYKCIQKKSLVLWSSGRQKSQQNFLLLNYWSTEIHFTYCYCKCFNKNTPR